MWKNLKIGKYEAKIFPLTFKMPTLPDCTKDGKEIVKIRGTKAPDQYFIKGTEEQVQKPTHKLVNGRAIPPAQATKAIREDHIEKAYSTKMIGSEMTYLVKDQLLKEHIEEEGPIFFPIITGRGYKALKAIVRLHKLDDETTILIMEVGRKLLKEINIKELLKETQAEDLKDQATEEDIAILAAI